MQKKFLLSTMLGAVVGIGLSVLPASAATIAYSSGDLLLGFRAGDEPGATNDLLVNLGQASIYMNLAPGTSVTVNTGLNLGEDLKLFGNSWFSRSDVFWSISGTSGLSGVGSDPAKTLYLTKAGVTAQAAATAWSRLSSTNQGIVDSQMRAMADAYKQVAGVPNTSTVNSAVTLKQSTTAANSYAFYLGNGASFGRYNPTIEGDFAAGATNSALDLYRMTPGSGDGQYVGRFTISNSGVLTFTASAVPEPSVLALAGLAVLALGGSALRRRFAKS